MPGNEAESILLIEDDNGIASLICEKLEGRGLRVARVKNGAEARAWLGRERSRLIILDYSLPDILGDSFISGVKDAPPFIVVTGAGNESIAVTMMKRGARDYLIKDSDLLNRLPMTVERVLKELDTEAQLAQSERALRESEEKFRNLYNNAESAMFRTKLDGSGFIDVNDKLCEIVGYKREELIGRPTVINWADPSEREEMTRRLKAEGYVKDFEWRLLTKSGEVRNCLTSLKLYAEDGILEGSFIDITERKRAENELRRSEEMLKDAQRLSHLGHWYWDIGMEKLTWSEEIFRIFGVDPQTFAVSAENLEKMIHPDDLASFLKQREEMLAKETDVEIGHRIVRPDGETRYVLERSNVLRDDSGNVLYVIGTVQDITERKQTEIELREKEIQYHNLADSGLALIWASGTDKLCNYFNQPWLQFTGRTLEQEMGNGWAEGVHPDDFDRCLEIYVTAFDKRERFDMEYRLRHASGEYRWVRDLGTPAYDSAGEFTGYIGHCFDVTERKRADESLKTSLIEMRQRQVEVEGLLSAARAILENEDFRITARYIFDSAKQLIGVTAGYVALLTPDGQENEVLFLDSGDHDCKVDASLPMPIRGLRGEAYASGKAVFDNDFAHSEWKRFIPQGHAELENVMFAPLMIEGRVRGLLGLANKPGGFTENDLRMATAFGELAAIALRNSQVTDQLRESENRLKFSQGVAHVGHWTWDTRNNRVTWSDEMYRIFGLDPETFDGDLDKVVAQAIHPDDREKVNASNNAVITEGRPAPLEYRVVRPDGSVRTVWAEAGEKVVDDNGEVIYLSGIVQDITERKHAEDALRESHDLNASLIQTIPFGMDIVGEDGSILYGNFSLERAAGGTVIGKRCWSLYRDDKNQCEGCPLKEPIQIGLTKTIERVGVFGGKTFEITHTGMIYQGRKAILEIFHDITERKRAEHELRLQAAVLQNVAEGIYLIGLDDGLIKYANARFESMFGYEPGELLGKNVALVNAPTERSPEATRDDISSVLRDTGEWHGEVLNIKKDGTVFWCYANVVLFDHPEYGKVFISIHTDITERKQAEEAQRQLAIMQEADRVRTELLSNVSHELRNPLGLILFLSTALRKPELDLSATQRAEFMQDIEHEARSLQSIVDNLLDAARLQEGRFRINPIAADMRVTLADMAKRCEMQMVHHTLDVRLPKTSLPAFIDAEKFEQVLRNLLDNAVKFSPQRSVIILSAKLDGDEIRIAVTDEGRGIPLAERERVFDRFYRIKRPGDDIIPGLGLGLAISREIINAHNGQLWVEENPQGGSAFVIALPLAWKMENNE